MSRVSLLLPVLALAAGMSTAPVRPAAAQCRLCDAPTTQRDLAAADGPVGLEIETSLDFDRLILLGAGEGTATLLPDGSRSVSGMIGDISGRAMVGSAIVRGEAGRAEVALRGRSGAQPALRRRRTHRRGRHPRGERKDRQQERNPAHCERS